MSVFVVARRELAEKRFVFIAAAVLAVIPFAGLLIPAARQMGLQNFVATLGAIAAAGFAGALALVTGVSTIGRELADKRMSFYFARPLTAPAIWFGKVLASMLSVALCFAIVFTPTMLYAYRTWSASWNLDIAPLLAVMAVICVTLFLVGHTAGTMARSRSPLVLVDLTLLSIFLGLMWMLIRRLLLGRAEVLAADMVLTLLVVVLCVLLAAGAWQLQRGRIDRLRNHRELSKFVWTSLAVVTAIAAGFVAWIVTPSLASLQRIWWGKQSPAGPWMVVGGEMSRFGYHQWFLVNLDDGSNVRIGLPDYATPAFSADGGTVAYGRVLEIRSNRQEIVTRTLRPLSEPRETGVIVGGGVRGLALSADGSRMATIEDGQLRVDDLAAHRLLASTRLPGDFPNMRYRVAFVSPSTVRLATTRVRLPGVNENLPPTSIYELDVAGRTMTKTGEYLSNAKFSEQLLSADGTRMLVRNFGDDTTRQLELADARTGAVVASNGERERIRSGMLVDRDRVSYVVQNGERLTLRTFAPGEAPRTVTDLGTYQAGWLVGKAGEGRVVVGLLSTDSQLFRHKEVPRDGHGWSAEVVDLKTGSIIRREDGLLPTFTPPSAISSDPGAPAPPLLFVDRDGTTVSWNPISGEKKVVFRATPGGKWELGPLPSPSNGE